MGFDDSDMKIAPDHLSEVFDMSEGAANAFVREKNNGNMEKARILGVQFAEELLSEKKGALLFGVGEFDDDCTIAQRRVLFSYLSGKVIEEIAPNSIVAQSALAAFQERVRQVSDEIYSQLTDSAVLSLYILAGRSCNDDHCAIGKVFARLCGRGNDDIFIRYGNELADYFTMYCTQLALRIQLIR